MYDAGINMEKLRKAVVEFVIDENYVTSAHLWLTDSENIPATTLRNLSMEKNLTRN
jgi:hypothetical protein